MSNLSTLPKGDSAWLLRKAIERIMEQVSVLETNIGSSTTGNSLNGQIIFNDNGTLRGDTGLTYTKATTTLRAGLLIVPGNTQLATVGTLYVGSLGAPKLKVDVGGTGITTITEATITGALTAGTTTLVAHAAGYTGKVGIGTATPSETLDVKGTGNFNNTSGTYLGFQTNAAQVGYIGTANTILAGGLNTQLGLWANSSLVIATGASALQRLRVEAAGDVTVSTGNVVMATSGKGIDFSATANGSGTMTSELLNDYEEGTFTPTITGSTAAGVGTYSNQIGRYTKIGNQVTVWIRISWSAHTGTGDMRISDLPFAIANVNNLGPGAAIGYSANITLTAGNYLMLYGNPGTTRIDFWQTPTGGGVTATVSMDSSADIGITMTYIV